MLLRLVLLLVVELATSDDRLARQGAFAALLSDLDADPSASLLRTALPMLNDKERGLHLSLLVLPQLLSLNFHLL